MKSSVSRGRALKSTAGIPFAALAVGATLSAAQGAAPPDDKNAYSKK